jgi:hypothetical protein
MLKPMRRLFQSERVQPPVPVPQVPVRPALVHPVPVRLLPVLPVRPAAFPCHSLASCKP